MMAVQFISYLNLTFNFRAMAHMQYTVVVFTDAMAVALSVFIIRKVSKAENNWGLAGQMIGGSVAGVLGMWLTRMWG
jgi:hypothetical protein